jgi:hypothetical protein
MVRSTLKESCDCALFGSVRFGKPSHVHCPILTLQQFSVHPCRRLQLSYRRVEEEDGPLRQY